MNTKKKTKLLIFGVITFVLVATFGVSIFIKEQNTKKDIIFRLTEVAESHGLENVNIVITSKNSEYDWYDINVESSNMNTLSIEKIFSLDKAMSGLDDVFIHSYISNDDKYDVYASSLSIYKNGKIIYDDYKNSNSYKSAQNNKDSGKSSNESFGNSVVDDNELGACWALAENVVKSQLKSPSSAKFPFSYANKDVSITKSGNIYTVKAWVDADNSFGATIRNNFTVTMEKSGSGKNAKFTSISCVID